MLQHLLGAKRSYKIIQGTHLKLLGNLFIKHKWLFFQGKREGHHNSPLPLTLNSFGLLKSLAVKFLLWTHLFSFKSVTMEGWNSWIDQ